MQSNNATSTALTQCRFQGNEADVGGAVAVLGSLFVSNCTFEGNRAERYHANLVVGNRNADNAWFASGAAVGLITPYLWEYAYLAEDAYVYAAPGPGFYPSTLELT